MTMPSSHRPLRWLAAFLLIFPLLGRAADPPEPVKPSRPNILWIVAEDLGCDMGAYGTAGVHTPHLNALAADGALFTRAYTTAPVCSPSRSSFMTGLNPHQVFSKNMRIREPLEKQPLPDGVKVFTEHLRAAGYAVGLCNQQKRDWGFIEPETSPYDTADWDQLTKKTPFFCQYQFYDTHRVNEKGPDGKLRPFLPCPEHPVDRQMVKLPPDTPDTPEAREELAAYLENLNLLDMKVGALLADLKARGLYESTLIVFMGDNGPPLFRGKGFLHERGIRMPLIVRMPAACKPTYSPGARIHELVSALDLAPTFIHLAGGKAPAHLEGRIFLGPGRQPAPSHLFAMRDRIDDHVDRIRSVCSQQFKYIRNFLPEKPCFEVAHNNVAASTSGRALFEQGKLSGSQAAYYQPKPNEELYDLENDPFELTNLAADPRHRETLATHRAQLDRWMQRTRDDGQFEDPEQLKEMDRRWAEFVKKRRPKAQD